MLMAEQRRAGWSVLLLLLLLVTQQGSGCNSSQVRTSYLVSNNSNSSI